MTREFSKEFINDMGFLMEQCAKNHTNRCSVEMQVGDSTVIIDVSFKVKEQP